jgi:hypothetical protein
MNNEELTDLIIKELSKHHERKEIARKVCEQSNLNWSEAERLIEQVETQNKRTIAGRQSPFLIFLSIATLILGLGLLAYNMQFLIHFFQKDTVEQILSLRGGYYELAGLITGVSMTIGGFYGVWKTLASLLPD